MVELYIRSVNSQKSSYLANMFMQLMDCRRNLSYQDVLDKLTTSGISIRVASPKLVMEEVISCDVKV